ncbi:LCP family protein [Clostridium carnis]
MKKLSLKKKILITILSILIIIISFGVIYTTYLSNKVNRVEVDRSSITDTGKEAPKEAEDVITVALLGTDYSGDTIGASDSTMILAIDTKLKKVKLCSLMRDIYLDLPDGGKQNLNYTMVDGGPSLTLKTINFNFNLKVDKFVQVDLRHLPSVIDTLGGVILDITPDEFTHINGYIDGINKENGTSSPHINSPGKQVLNGTQAAAYCRIRYTAGRDYRRTERQRDVLSALFDQVKDTSFSEVPGVVNSLLPLVSTNLTNSEILSIASKVLSMGVSNIEQGRFPVDEDHTAEWTDMYHMIIDVDATTKKLHNFLYSTNE